MFEDKVKGISSFIWYEIIAAIAMTLIVRNPCKKCLVQACCSETCNLKKDYLKFCDTDGKIWILRFCAITIIFSCSVFSFGIFTIVFK